MADIPSSGFIPEDPGGTFPNTVGSTAVIPGSNVAETTGLRQRTLPQPPMGPNWQNKIAQLLMITGAGLGDVYRPPGLKTNAALKEVQQMQVLRDERAARQAMGYIARLQAFAASTPSRAQDAMLDLSDFLTTNAEHIPVPVLARGQQALDQLRGLDVQEKTKQAALSFVAAGGAVGPQLDAYGRMVKAGMPHEQALPLAHLVPASADKWEKTFDQKGNRLILFDKVSQQVQVVPLPTPEGTNLEDMTIENLPVGVRNEASKARISIPGLVAGVNRKEPSALAQLDALTRASEATALKTEERKARVKLTPRQITYLTKAGLAGKQYHEDLTPQEAGILIREEDKDQDRDRLQQVIDSRLVEVFDTQGRQAPGLGAIDVKAGRAVTVRHDDAQQIRTMNAILPQLDDLQAVAARVLVATKDTPGLNLVQAIKLAVGRGLMTNEDAAMFQAIAGPLGLQLTKMYQGSRPSDLDLQSALKILPKETDTFVVAARKLNFLRRQGAYTKQALLGVAYTPFTRAAILAEYPDLVGELGSVPIPGEPRKIPGLPGTFTPKGAQ
mgnify:CR=1 FL=1